MNPLKKSKFLKEALEGFLAKLAYYADVSKIIQMAKTMLLERIKKILLEFSRSMNEDDGSSGVFTYLCRNSKYNQEYDNEDMLFSVSLNERIIEAFKDQGIDVSFLADLDISPLDFARFVMELARELEDLGEEQEIPQERVREFVGVYVEKYQIATVATYYELGNQIVIKWQKISVLRKAYMVASSIPECHVVGAFNATPQLCIEESTLEIDTETKETMRTYKIVVEPLSAEKLKRMTYLSLKDKSSEPEAMFAPVRQAVEDRSVKMAEPGKIVDITDEEEVKHPRGRG